jgi:hypothetical protein
VINRVLEVLLELDESAKITIDSEDGRPVTILFSVETLGWLRKDARLLFLYPTPSSSSSVYDASYTLLLCSVLFCSLCWSSSGFGTAALSFRHLSGP